MNANECYEIHRNKVDELITKLQQDLVKLDEKQAKNPDDWSFAIKIGRIQTELYPVCIGVENVGT